MGPTLPNLGITYEQLRSIVLQTLRETSCDQMASLREEVGNQAIKMNLAHAQDPRSSMFSGSGNALSRDDYANVLNIMWDLIIEGVVRPGLRDGTNNNLPFFHVTDRGKSILKSESQTPYDPDGYLTCLKIDVPDVDPVIITYLNESLHTFRISCLLSSTIALGCASEKALLLLIAAYGDSLPQKQQERFKKDTEGRMIKRQFEELRKMLDSELRGRLPRDLEDGLDVELNAIFDFIRNQRNDAGHPTGKTIARERAYANLVVFPVYVRKVYALIDWLKANTKP